MKTVIETSILHRKTHNLLQNRSRKLTLEKISEDLEISLSWLREFSRDEIPNPGVNIIVKLYDYLSSKPLKV